MKFKLDILKSTFSLLIYM